MARRRRLHNLYRRNPEGGTALGSMAMGEVWEWIGPGFAAFAAARFVTYLATGQIEKWRPSWGRHAGAIAAAGTFVATWMLAHRVKFLSRWVEPIVIGTGLAGAQSLLQIYVPKLGWMVGDPTIAATDATQQAVNAASQLPPGFTAVDEDLTAFEFNDAHDPGIYGSNPQPAAATQQAAQASDDVMDDLDLDQSSMQGGIFAGA